MDPPVEPSSETRAPAGMVREVAARSSLVSSVASSRYPSAKATGVSSSGLTSTKAPFLMSGRYIFPSRGSTT